MAAHLLPRLGGQVQGPLTLQLSLSGAAGDGATVSELPDLLQYRGTAPDGKNPTAYVIITAPKAMHGLTRATLDSYDPAFTIERTEGSRQVVDYYIPAAPDSAECAQQARALRLQVEHHVLANHLFANGKALAFAGAILALLTGLGDRQAYAERRRPAMQNVPAGSLPLRLPKLPIMQACPRGLRPARWSQVRHGRHQLRRHRRVPVCALSDFRALGMESVMPSEAAGPP